MADIKDLMALLMHQSEEARLAREESRLAREQHASEMLLLVKQNEDLMLKLTSASGSSTRNSQNSDTAKLMTDLNGRLTCFIFDPESDQTFSRWYERSEEVFTIDGADLEDAAKVRLLIGKLCDDVFERYKRHILPKTPGDLPFVDTIKQLKELFDVKRSLFTLRYHCLKLSKLPTEDFMEYTGRVNEQCEKAKLHDLDSDGAAPLSLEPCLTSSH